MSKVKVCGYFMSEYWSSIQVGFIGNMIINGICLYLEFKVVS